MYCQMCGAENGEEAQFCVKCGARTRLASPESGGGAVAEPSVQSNPAQQAGYVPPQQGPAPPAGYQQQQGYPPPGAYAPTYEKHGRNVGMVLLGGLTGFCLGIIGIALLAIFARGENRGDLMFGSWFGFGATMVLTVLLIAAG